MAIEAKVIRDSIAAHGKRITTLVLKYPRFIHSEFMTHRDFSRNSASSRAIPIKKMIQAVKDDPAMPIFWGKNQPGMQAAEELDADRIERCKSEWLSTRDAAIDSVEYLMYLGLHKQIANRILEPWFHMSTIVTATEWSNFFSLRLDAKAPQPEMQALARAILVARKQSVPKILKLEEWHLPFVSEEEWKTINNIQQSIWCSAARCARVSYLNHDGTNPNVEKDLELAQKLLQAPHASPFEHQATPDYFEKVRSGNFVGWIQYRKTMNNEYNANFEEK